jgi:NAD(P)-dependent dehydrogenase (short-subunit alcohol dehydrogenase family)
VRTARLHNRPDLDRRRIIWRQVRKIEELFSVRGKVALVTGGSRGIGEMIARAYVENGAKVYITAHKAEACDALANELSKQGKVFEEQGILFGYKGILEFLTSHLSD